ncbi:MAG: hypothetical protein SAJ12_14605 [Jaaginema sp. PMC 1079.18]|nr:hypothetical protein [Jaaginema sp. PMC 1080.18]MEC4852215.1 hypothetical protein [Jaaginema sp. PMC 1079.18]MEC4864827.1 hypothetical protein [Jaaginema sp. PMC 1078.18]
MESSGSPANASEPPNHRWARAIGTAIAIVTLTVPTLAIAYYSSSNNRMPLLPPPYSVRTSRS